MSSTKPTTQSPPANITTTTTAEIKLSPKPYAYFPYIARTPLFPDTAPDWFKEVHIDSAAYGEKIKALNVQMLRVYKPWLNVLVLLSSTPIALSFLWYPLLSKWASAPIYLILVTIILSFAWWSVSTYRECISTMGKLCEEWSLHDEEVGVSYAITTSIKTGPVLVITRTHSNSTR
ncbi:hypothetical protein HDU76_008187 [Blyttiomyces sp. JEL0837]|nr:hypothetical protein HDU76_008187 [Blyttiomyces sp. JEL0837]